eukprot:4172594-Pyramimonas_sp.AAC.1
MVIDGLSSVKPPAPSYDGCLLRGFCFEGGLKFMERLLEVHLRPLSRLRESPHRAPRQGQEASTMCCRNATP